jgi:hypothetical protein
LRQVIEASFISENQSLKVVYLTRKKKNGRLSLANASATLNGTKEAAERWADSLLAAAYHGEILSRYYESLRSGIKRRRRLKVIVNPYGGVVRVVFFFLHAA